MIISTFNPLWIALLLLTVGATAGFSKYSRKLSEKQLKRFYLIAHIICYVVFFFYKNAILHDEAYLQLKLSLGEVPPSFWNEQLLFHLCNMLIYLIPIGVLTDSTYILSLCFLMGPYGVILALLMPTAGFTGVSILIPRVMGYYVTHLFLLFSSVSLFTTGIYRPKYKDIPKCLVMLLIVTFTAFMVNMILRWTGLSNSANYFYTMASDGNPILQFLLDLMGGIPWVYELVLFPPAGLVFLLETYLLQKFTKTI